uniref:Tumor necrosis factor receptor superfamily member 5-like n=1 Tax=Poecilia reticulata TaxID=8081 RepID=A0A3P9NFE0_POERE
MLRWPVTYLLMVILIRDFRVYSTTCHLTEYKTLDGCCPMCPAGHRVKTDCTEFSSTSCLPCSDGTHLDQSNGLKSCTRCSICHSGAGLKVKQQCLRSADTVCEPMEGFYCTDSTSGGCAAAQKHRSCEPGQYISRMGTASTDTECSECSSGTFSNGTMLSCQLHTQCEKENLQLIKAGTTTTDAECGEKNDSITGVGIIVLVVSLVIVVSVIVAIVALWRKKKITLQDIFKSQPKPQRGPAEGAEQGECLTDPVQETPN